MLSLGSQNAPVARTSAKPAVGRPQLGEERSVQLRASLFVPRRGAISYDEVVSENIWETIEVENTNQDLLPFLLTIPLQKLAYYSALKKGFDIDKPRNLAKSVTVE